MQTELKGIKLAMIESFSMKDREMNKKSGEWVNTGRPDQVWYKMHFVSTDEFRTHIVIKTQNKDWQKFEGEIVNVLITIIYKQFGNQESYVIRPDRIEKTD